MNCINKVAIQKYIDRECSDAEALSIQQHLISCATCQKKYEEQLQLSRNIKQAINGFTDTNRSIPTFKNTRATKKTNFKAEIVYTLSAACIILFMLLFVDKNKENTHCESILSNTYEFNSNQPVTEQALIVNYVDAEGNQSEIYIQ